MMQQSAELGGKEGTYLETLETCYIGVEVIDHRCKSEPLIYCYANACVRPKALESLIPKEL